ncbi:MAG TPA: Rieske 2Fe-2S domain-containing protein [Pirellulales bacterium]|jgi:nitrite reductase/ring-hydroxylating ferredoxin subunit|nr:Rieske 2Fe-2S domain-containing protein [Pirellulales bacterium]
MARWVRIGAVGDCPPGESKELVAEDLILALFNVDGTFYVLDGVCPHQGGPLGKGCLAAAIVTCPWHGWQFDVRTGEHQLNHRLHQPAFETRVEADAVWVNLER